MMGPILAALWTANYKVYGAYKLWKAAGRAGHDIGRDQVARLMKAEGIRGVRRGKRYVTTRPDGTARASDLVDRNFTATRPNALWVPDLTHGATLQGVAYVCFIIDAFSRANVGWRVAGRMRTDMVLDALERCESLRGWRRVDVLIRFDSQDHVKTQILLRAVRRRVQPHHRLETRSPRPR